MKTRTLTFALCVIGSLYVLLFPPVTIQQVGFYQGERRILAEQQRSPFVGTELRSIVNSYNTTMEAHVDWGRLLLYLAIANVASAGATFPLQAIGGAIRNSARVKSATATFFRRLPYVPLMGCGILLGLMSLDRVGTEGKIAALESSAGEWRMKAETAAASQAAWLKNRELALKSSQDQARELDTLVHQWCDRYCGLTHQIEAYERRAAGKPMAAAGEQAVSDANKDYASELGWILLKAERIAAESDSRPVRKAIAVGN